MTRCTLGVGCDEHGMCYALAMGQPGQCGNSHTLYVQWMERVMQLRFDRCCHGKRAR